MPIGMKAAATVRCRSIVVESIRALQGKGENEETLESGGGRADHHSYLIWPLARFTLVRGVVVLCVVCCCCRRTKDKGQNCKLAF
jgi:hypothetical protein